MTTKTVTTKVQQNPLIPVNGQGSETPANTNTLQPNTVGNIATNLANNNAQNPSPFEQIVSANPQEDSA